VPATINDATVGRARRLKVILIRVLSICVEISQSPFLDLASRHSLFYICLDGNILCSIESGWGNISAARSGNEEGSKSAPPAVQNFRSTVITSPARFS